MTWWPLLICLPFGVALGWVCAHIGARGERRRALDAMERAFRGVPLDATGTHALMLRIRWQLELGFPGRWRVSDPVERYKETTTTLLKRRAEGIGDTEEGDYIEVLDKEWHRMTPEQQEETNAWVRGTMKSAKDGST